MYLTLTQVISDRTRNPQTYDVVAKTARLEAATLNMRECNSHLRLHLDDRPEIWRPDFESSRVGGGTLTVNQFLRWKADK